MVSIAAFDDLAASYDDTFTESVIGRLLRAAVWRRLDAQFRAGDRVLELNCGTGADAIHLAHTGVRVLATDVSEAMLDVTRRKVAQAGMAELVQVAKLDIAELAAIGDRRSEIRDQRSEIGDRRSEIRDQRSEIGIQRSEFRDRGLRESGGAGRGRRAAGVGLPKPDRSGYFLNSGLAAAQASLAISSAVALPFNSLSTFGW